MKFLTILITSTLCLASCEFLGLSSPSFQSPQSQPAKVTSRISHTESSPGEVKSEPLSPSNALSDITITWKVPTETVEGFIVKFGPSREKLTSQIRVVASTLQIVEDSNFGKVYHYVLHGLPRSEPLFISVASYEGNKVSPFSGIVEVPAN